MRDGDLRGKEKPPLVQGVRARAILTQRVKEWNQKRLVSDTTKAFADQA